MRRIPRYGGWEQWVILEDLYNGWGNSRLLIIDWINARWYW